MKEKIRKGFVWIVKHPWIALFGVVLFVILLTFIPSGSGEDEAVKKSPTESIESAEESSASSPGGGFDSGDPDGEEKEEKVPPAVSEESDTKQDESSPFDDDGRRREDAFRDIAADPAVQHLPYRGALITADIVDRVGGKLVVHVKYMGDRSFAVREWREFLASHSDNGKSYQVVYIEKK